MELGLSYISIWRYFSNGYYILKSYSALELDHRQLAQLLEKIFTFSWEKKRWHELGLNIVKVLILLHYLVI